MNFSRIQVGHPELKLRWCQEFLGTIGHRERAILGAVGTSVRSIRQMEISKRKLAFPFWKKKKVVHVSQSFSPFHSLPPTSKATANPFEHQSFIHLSRWRLEPPWYSRFFQHTKTFQKGGFFYGTIPVWYIYSCF